ncbi:ABC transporter ATP-binding protein [Brevundimonas sp. SL130]|uniref:ABC transporter ATP-binding protein n=1 Tax=Brevundimonas sp. SL130 TaxID=2995143 RepID=UPI00226CAE17|nr:ABC transporter ATP-binding protein [Brevundimonas sp. SL130]WAC60329.1 ABC transporter ATP-binding protein [Brevundimonas sp. SL130]
MTDAVSGAGLSVSNLGLTYRTAHRPVFSNLNFSLGRQGRLAILGRNGQGKSTLIKLLGGVMSPTQGRIDWGMSQSWPIGFNGGFQGSLSGLDNIRFLARIYGRPFNEVRDRVDDFAELGRSLRLPVKHYSSGMRARLAFGLSLAIEFDCYLIDELVAVGDARFQRKCQHELFQQRAERAFLLASHNTDLISVYCDRALLVEGGKAKIFEDIGEAVEIYKWLRTV